MEEFFLEAKKVSFILSVGAIIFILIFTRMGGCWRAQLVDSDIKLRGPENKNENPSGWWF